MKNKLIALLAFFLMTGQIAQAQEDTSDTNSNASTQTEPHNSSMGILNQMTGELLYGYMNFNFNSNTGNNFSNYEGHSNLYSVGADQLKLWPTYTGGIYYFKVNTNLNSQIILEPSPLSTASQSINNNTIFAHIMKNINSQFYVDLAGGYGFNSISLQSLVFADTKNQGLGFANYDNNNWFTSLNGLYSKTFNNWLFRAGIGGLYSQIDTGSYTFNLQSSFPDQTTQPFSDQTVNPLTTKTTFLFETVEVGYSINSGIMPFINGALIQVVQFSNSRPLVFAQINGTLPQLNINQNGFRVGAGVAFTYKQFKLRIEDKYYNAGDVFTSNQGLVGLEYQFS